jgi:hypothetical protein
MERPVEFDACFDTLQLPSIAGGNVLHLHALQRYVTPIVHAELESVFSDAANSNRSASASASEKTKKSTKLMRFQDALQDEKQRSGARSNLLARVLSHALEPSAAQCISLVESAAFSCAHTLLASQAHTAALFGAHQQRRMPINTKTTPLTLLHSIYVAACDAAYEQPFLFLRDVRAPEYVAKRQKLVALIDDLVEAKLYDVCAASIASLRTDMVHSKRTLLRSQDISRAQSLTASQSAKSAALASTESVASASHCSESVHNEQSQRSAQRSKQTCTADQGGGSASRSKDTLKISLPPDCQSHVLRSLGALSEASGRAETEASTRVTKEASPIVKLVDE